MSEAEFTTTSSSSSRTLKATHTNAQVQQHDGERGEAERHSREKRSLPGFSLAPTSPKWWFCWRSEQLTRERWRHVREKGRAHPATAADTVVVAVDASPATNPCRETAARQTIQRGSARLGSARPGPGSHSPEGGQKRSGVPLGVKDGRTDGLLGARSINNAGAESPQIHQSSSSSSSSSPRPPLCLSTARTAAPGALGSYTRRHRRGGCFSPTLFV